MLQQLIAVIAAIAAGLVPAQKPPTSAPADSQTSAKAARLEITRGGTPTKPLVYDGHGKAVDGITVDASNVVVQNYKIDKAEAPSVEVTGNHITVQKLTITNPKGGDGDGLRFFGNDLKILDNTISGARNTDDRHADCMQTFADDTPPSQRVLIEGNRCEKIDNMCLMAEGPNDGEGDGHGHSNNFTFRNNYCETLDASQALMIEDIQHLTVTGNTFAAAPDKAIGLAIHSTDAHITKNKLSTTIECYVGIDTSSRPGYQGPKPGCAP
ncbi:right-handed parallel beta-helix repeat-containing protein [Kribbella sp. NPDC055071]